MDNRMIEWSPLPDLWHQFVAQDPEELYELPSLPYASAYQTWTDHERRCERCRTVASEHGGISQCCLVGSTLQIMLHSSVSEQNETSLLN